MRQIKIVPTITDRKSESLDRYLQEINKPEILSIDEEVELSRRIKSGDQEALNRLICANLRFVVSVAKQYQGQGMSLVDLINEGNMGLITAAGRFDETRGFKFISYAVWWIRQSILQALAEKGRLVRIPQNQVELITKVNRYLSRYIQEHERMPSEEEVSEALGLTRNQVTTALQSGTKHISMDAPLVEDEDSCLLDLIFNNESNTPDTQLAGESLKEEVQNALAALPDRERKVLQLYFGIGYPEQGLEEIGRKMNLSRERVRQIKEKAISLLRGAHESYILKGYLG